MIGLLEFHLAHSEMLLTASTNQLLYDLSLIELCSPCAKENAALKTANDACSLLAKKTLFDLAGEYPSSLIISFKKSIKSFLVWNIYLTFFLLALFYKSSEE